MMKQETMRNVGLFALRLSVGSIFVVHGWAKLQGIEGVGTFFGSLGIPAAGFFAWVVALVEFVGGLALIAGVYPRLAAKLLVVDMVIALLVAHLGGKWSAAELAVAMLGSCLAILAIGPGAWTLIKKDCVCKVCAPKM